MAKETVEVNKVITKVDKSTKSMEKVIVDLNKVMTELTTLTDVASNLSFDIEEKSSELEQIKVNITESERKANAELSIRILENADKVLENLLKERSLARITYSELNELRSSLDLAKADNSEAIASAVASAEKSAAISYSASRSKLESDHAVASAKLEADNSSLQSKIAFLEQSVTDLKEMLKSEREARVEMSKNASQPTINVGQQK